ncbi:MAG: Squalene/phytoene synthase [Fibrobacteres bacterium]|nr:Squalene/phytoene synthase [Fibrobacterota bacterium]
MFLISAKTDDPRTEATWKKAMADGRIDDPKGFAAFMLGKTSRTFALNIQVLPTGLRRQVLLAYLFCRMADTLEDDGELGETTKISLLESFRGLFPPGPDKSARLAAFRADLPPEWARSERWDRLLVHHCDWIYPQLSEFPEAVVSAISRCVDEMSVGMIDFTRRQAKTRAGQVLIESIADLDRYCYYVAGTVGNLLCDLFTLHSPLIGTKRAQDLRALSVSFGVGLQLTNILKDVQEDRRRNVSYIPNSLLEEEGLTESEFLSSEGESSEKPGSANAAAARIMARLIEKAAAHLRDALEYSCLLPRLEPRLRLFCLWPLFMAVENLVLMGESLNGFQSEGKLKITRKQVKDIVGRTSLACWSNLWIRSMFRGSMDRLQAALARTQAGARPGAQHAADAVSGAMP